VVHVNAANCCATAASKIPRGHRERSRAMPVKPPVECHSEVLVLIQMAGMLSTEKPKSNRGGRRFGAGRKKSRDLRYDPSHARRPELSFKHPVHVMLRTDWRVPRLRQRKGYEAIRRVLLFCLGGDDFRVVHVSIQKNHIHLIVEAANKDALRRGMQRFAIRAARAINAALDREGKVFAFRYNAKQIRTASYARNAICYVLNNWRRHREEFYEGEADTLFDAYSSATSFAGWTGKQRVALPESFPPLPVSVPQTRLLKFDWEWHGLIDPWETPGPLR
jgi:REP element-mobilizing transposase RayT